MKHNFYLISLSLFCINVILAGQNKADSAVHQNNIALDYGPDLELTFQNEFQNIHLEAFKSLNNDKILFLNNTKRYPQLLWTSLGNPKLVKRKSIIDDSLQLFHFTPEEIYVYIEMLTEEHKQLLADSASKKYSQKIDKSQIINLILSKFECSLKFFDGQNTISLYGKVTQFRKFPLRLDILAPETAIERKLLLDRLNDSLNIDLVLNCELATETNSFSRQLSLYTVESSEESNEIQKIYSLVNMVNTEFDAFKTQLEKQYSLVNSKFLLINHEAEKYQFEVNRRLSEIESKIHKEFTILQGRDMIQFDESFLQVLENLGSRKVSKILVKYF
jgi:hypothetical protein